MPLRLAWLELRRFRSGIPRLVLAGLAAIPLTYGAVYLWAYWDPFGNLKNVPVAVVNEDQPVTVRGQRIAAGEEIVSNLQRTRSFDYHFVSAATAQSGLTAGTYFFTITIPRDFSAHVASGTRGSPRQATVHFTLDDQNGFLVSEFVRTARTELAQQIAAAAVTGYTQSAVGDLAQLRSLLEKAQAGLRTVHDGTAAASAGAQQLVDALAPLEGGTSSFTDAAQSAGRSLQALAQLGHSVSAGLVPASSAVLSSLIALSGDAASGAATVAAGADGLAAKARQLTAALRSLASAVPGAAQQPAYTQALNAAQALESAAASVQADASRLQGDTRSLTRSLTELQRSAAAVNGASASGTVITEAQQAVTEATDGLTALHDAVSGSAAGARKLAASLHAITTGVEQIEQDVDAGLAQVPALTPAQQERTARFLGSPVRVVTDEKHPASVYGRGFAPFFFSIGLWVFGLFCYLALHPLSPWLLASRARSATVVAAGWLSSLLLGICGVLLLFAVCELALGLDSEHILATLAIMVLTVGAFAAIIQLFRAWLGVVGDAVGLVLLMLQLGAAGGIYPPQASAGFFRALHPFVPMSYSIDALRITISGGDTGHVVRDAIVLAAFLLAALTATTLVAHRQRLWTMERLHPSIEL